MLMNEFVLCMYSPSKRFFSLVLVSFSVQLFQTEAYVCRQCETLRDLSDLVIP